MAYNVEKLVSLLEAARENRQPITLGISLDVLGGIVEYCTERALEDYKAEEERKRAENDNGDLLLPREARKLLRVSDATLWRYVRNGDVHKRMICGKPYYSRREIMGIINGKED